MSGLFRGALTLIQGESSSSASHPLIGTQVEVGSIRLRVDSLIAEGGFAVVFAAYDNANRWYALKRQLTKDRESMDAVLLEIRILKELSGHPAILEFIAAAQMKIPSGGVEFMLLTELCSGGSVADLMKNVRLVPEQALKIFYAASRAVCHMHDRKIPITHRDIKIENLLFDMSGRVKLCDFGSATTEIYSPDETWNMARRTHLEEEMQRHTTPMYRAPEILDTYQNFVVGPQQDIWALGCVLFYLCYHVHPFEDSAKLRILNVAYTVPSGFDEFLDVLPVIESCLKVDPIARPIAGDLVERTEALAAVFEVDLKQPVSNVDTGMLRRSQPQRPAGSAQSAAAPPRPPPPRSTVVSEEMTEQASAMFGAIRGQGLSLLKNLKDRSSAVVQKVQAKLASQEVTWLTSRMCVVPIGRAALDQYDEDDWVPRVAPSGRPFVVFNLTPKTLRGNYQLEPISLSMRSVHPLVPPPIETILRICSSVVTFLRNRPLAAIVFYGLEAHCLLVSSAVLMYCKLIGDASDALDFISNKRRSAQRFSPSQIRTLDLIKNLTSSASVVLFPMSRPMLLCSLSFSSLPILAGIRSGLRPIVEVFVGTSKVWDSIGSKSAFTISKTLSSELEIGHVRLDGQVTVLMSYSRSDPSNPTSKKLLFCLVFHTGAAGELMKFGRTDIDVNAPEENNVPTDFRIAIGLRAISQDDSLRGDPSSMDSNVLRAGSPDLLVLDFEEQKQIMDWYSISTERSASTDAVRSEISSDVSHVPSEATSDFFQTLDWSQAQHAQQSQPIPSMSSRTTPPPPVPPHRGPAQLANPFEAFTSSDSQLPEISSTSGPNRGVSRPHGMETAEMYERQAGIRVREHAEDPDADKYRFDCEKETPILSAFTPPCGVHSEFDLLDLGEFSGRPAAAPPPTATAASDSVPALVDPFADLIQDNWTAPAPAPPPVPAVHTTGDLLGEWSSSSNLLGASTSSSIHRNVSAPAFQPSSGNFDPFAEFLSQSASNPTSTQASASNSGSTTPMPSRPNYSRSAFENINSSTTSKPKVAGDVFGDILSSQGFTASSKNANRTLGDLRRADEIKDMDPVSIKIRDWVVGKERNIRALLGSLNDVLWEGAEKWQQPSMADLLSAAQVKRCYRKACLVVHPDKQVGQAHEKLARAIFTELNDAWNAFEQAGSASL
ncbi:hypothetical protein Q1695_000318 [Nippostrongylus brasiliensis]|nr:hypothetical protein Q1695_000318 [Nippostrongylus brasiliensis]